MTDPSNLKLFQKFCKNSMATEKHGRKAELTYGWVTFGRWSKSDSIHVCKVNYFFVELLCSERRGGVVGLFKIS